MKKSYRIQPPIFLLFLLLCFWASGYSQTLNITMATTPACSLDGSATATVTGGTPPYTFHWYGPSAAVGNVNTGTVNTLTGVPGGGYTVYVSDAGSGSGSTYFTIATPFATTLSKTNDVCGAGVGTATVTATGGTPPFTYLWSNGQTAATATGLSPGYYQVTITDANGCFVSSQTDSTLFAYIYNTSPITVTTTKTNSTCSDGTATVTSATGGTAPYTYVWNTTPPQFTPAITNLAPGGYTVTVTDAVGCVRTASLSITQLANGLSAGITSTPEFCSTGNGTATVTVSGGTAPYTYLWNTGATTAVLTGLSYNHYHVTVTDALGCPITRHTNVGSVDPLNLGISGTQANCSNTGGTVSTTVSGGTAPYTYLWNTGATTSSITGLATGYYHVQVTDANGCMDYSSYHVTYQSNCFAYITGAAMIDMNSNCIFDGSDFGLSGRIIDIGSTWTVTHGAGGIYEYVTPGSYTVSQNSVPSNFQVVCPVGGSYTLTGITGGSTYPNNNFYNGPITNFNDLEVWIHATPARPTQPQEVQIHYRNKGTTILNGSINFTHDALMTLFYGYNMSGYNVGTRTVSYNLGFVNPGAMGYVRCSFTIPTLTPLSTPYSHSAEVLPNSSDVTPADNVTTFNNVVSSSYDPNRKSVVPDGLIQPGTDSILTYTVEFQNTGTDTAFTVAIRDTLDASLDALSIEVLGSSHAMEWDIDNPGYLVFTFDNIELPDSNINEPASHGWLMYRIKLKDNLSLGTQIRNTAAIYFDYNVPVITNTTLNMFGMVSADPRSDGASGFGLYPNPSNGQVQVQLDEAWEGETAVSVMDLSGKSILTTTINAENNRLETLALNGLPKGVYLVECRTDHRKQVKKLVLQ